MFSRFAIAVTVLLAVTAVQAENPLNNLFRESSPTILGWGPLHASCKVEYTFQHAKQEVFDKLKQAVVDLGGAENCGSGQKCLYKFVKEESNKISFTHETPKAHYIDDVSFTVSSEAGGVTKVSGYSTSETWYAVLDKGTNYCNLRNLIDAAGLQFSEQTSNSVCTQYSSHNCDVY
eukprot:GFYU01002907.1.p2 GENE.GFYU01002907.1~~GFYU01002907.1.p2  ORF type:complete len:176 (-),score=67.78 GFYU01002907.1:29-556(-)